MIRKCKDCGENVEVGKFVTVFRCDACKKKADKRSYNICRKCGNKFSKDKSARVCICDECKKDKAEKIRTRSKCLSCGKNFDRSHFEGKNYICIDCKKQREEDKKFKKEFRVCKGCNIAKKIGKEIYNTSNFCFSCKKEREHLRRRKTNVVRKCIKCCKDVPVEKARATIIYCKDCKKEKENLKLSIKHNKKWFRTCYICNEKEEVKDKHSPTTHKCENCKNGKSELNNKTYERKCKICGEKIITNNKLSTYIKCEKCKDKKLERKTIKIEDKFFRKCIKCSDVFEIDKQSKRYYCNKCSKKKCIRLSFDKKKHFGYYGIASDGHRWDSLNELDIEEWLIENKIEHIPHPRIGKTLYHADFLIKGLYVEMDGLGRSELEWKEKVDVYNKLGLKYKIITPVTHVDKDRKKCFEELSEKLIEVI